MYRVISMTDKVLAKFEHSDASAYLISFKFDCQVRNLTPKTIECYFERLGYLFSYLKTRKISFQAITMP